MAPDQVSYYFQQSLQNNSSGSGQQQQQQQPQQQIQSQQQQQVVQSGVQTIAVNQQGQQQQSQPQVIQPQPQQMNQNPQSQPPPGGIQIVQQIIGPNGEIQQIPILLNEQQLSLIRSQMIGGTNQPIVIQTAPIQASSQSVNQQTQQVYIQQE